VTLKLTVSVGSAGETETLKKQLLPAPRELPPVPFTNDATAEMVEGTPVMTFVDGGTIVKVLNLFAADARWGNATTAARATTILKMRIGVFIFFG
jgi:hypothetical protein